MAALTAEEADALRAKLKRPAHGPRRRIVVYDQATGRIKQVVTCFEADAEKQHALYPTHHFLDVTDNPEPVHPELHQVNLATGTIETKVPTLAEAKAKAILVLDRAYYTAIENAWAGTAHSMAEDPMAEFKTARSALKSRRDDLAEKIAAAANAATATAITF